MPEITVQFKNTLNGYNKQDVDRFLKEEIEPRLAQRSQEIAKLKQRVVELEARLKKLTGGDETVEQKVELYEKLMKKMDGNYENLLAPAIAKAKAIEEKANREYRIRMDQAKYTAEGIYAEVAERIVALLEGRILSLYRQIDDYIRSKRLCARIATAFKACAKALSCGKCRRKAKGKSKSGKKCACRCGKKTIQKAN